MFLHHRKKKVAITYTMEKKKVKSYNWHHEEGKKGGKKQHFIGKTTKWRRNWLPSTFHSRRNLSVCNCRTWGLARREDFSAPLQPVRHHEAGKNVENNTRRSARVKRDRKSWVAMEKAKKRESRSSTARPVSACTGKFSKWGWPYVIDLRTRTPALCPLLLTLFLR